MVYGKKLKRKLRRKIKYIKLKLITNKRIIFCRNVDSENYVNCANCRHTQRCYRKYLRRVKWII